MPNNDNKYTSDQVSRLILRETGPLKEQIAELKKRAEAAEASLQVNAKTTLVEGVVKEALTTTEAEIARRAAEALRARARYLQKTGYTSDVVAQVRHDAYWLQSTEGLEAIKGTHERKDQ